MSAVMTDNQNANHIPNDAKEKMIGKPLKVDAANITLADRKRLRSGCRLVHEMPQLSVELIGKLRRGYALVIGHDLVDVRINLLMKGKLHQLRRALICWSSCSGEILAEGSAASSASRRKASATPSSSSCSTDGSDSSRWAARTALWDSGKSNASFSISVIVGMNEA